MIRENLKSSSGFTLIELLVVVAIISLTSSIVLASLNSARAKAQDVAEVSRALQVQKAMELYFLDNGRYPTDGMVGNACDTNIQAPGLFCIPSDLLGQDGDPGGINTNTSALSSSLTPYISQLPDSLTGSDGTLTKMSIFLTDGTFDISTDAWTMRNTSDGANYCYFIGPNGFFILDRLSSGANNPVANPQGFHSWNLFLISESVVHGPIPMTVHGVSC
jgi:prepilin-type N-terminal cleavage/methylation domain-containing protein